MDIQKVPVSQINPAPYNPRLDLKPGDPDYEKLKKSIDEFGCVEILVWNKRTGTLVSGHQRFKVLKARGVQDVEASVVDLPLEKEKVLNLSLNKIRGDWNDEKLADLLQELCKLPDFDETLSGFGIDEISEILDKAKKAGEDDYDVEADVQSIVEPITKRGEIVALGNHRLMFGDSADPDDLRLLLGDEKIDLIHIDPPFGCQYLNSNRPHLDSRPKKSKDWGGLYKDNQNEEEYASWLAGIFENLKPCLKEGAGLYCWNGHAKFFLMYEVLTKLGFHVSTVITWAKPNFAISYGDYNQQTEFCIYAWLANGPHKWFGPTNESNLWEIRRDPESLRIHPTQKALEIPARAIRNSSVMGDLVVDLFSGSGSTLVAAETLDRRCYAMEMEPRYIDAAVRRFIALAPDKVSDEVKVKYLKVESRG